MEILKDIKYKLSKGLKSTLKTKILEDLNTKKKTVKK